MLSTPSTFLSRLSLLTLTTLLFAATPITPTTQPDSDDFTRANKAVADNNLPLALSYFQKAANAGNIDAMYQVGLFYAKGVPPLRKDNDKAFLLFQKSAAGGNANALYTVGIFYFQGLATPKDIPQALLYWQKAADAGSVIAMHNLAFLYSEGKVAPKDDAKSFYYYRLGALHGDASSYAPLAECYLHGTGTKVDYAQAIPWLQKLADKNNTEALFLLGTCYEHGGGVAQDLKLAVSYYQKAADLGHVKSMDKLAIFYASSQPPNFAQSILWWKKAAAAGDVDAAGDLARLYTFGKADISPDPALALQWSQKAADLGNANAMFLLARYYASSNPPDYPATISWLKKSAAAGEVDAASMLAAAYAKGGLGITQDNALFLEWYRKAADLGDPQAIAFFHNGTPTTLAATTEPTSQSALHPLFQFTIAFAVGNQGGYITLPVTINHKDYLFMVDTGATLTVFDPSITDLGASIDTRTADTADESFKINLYHPPAMSIANQPFSIAKVAAKDLSSLRQLTGQPIMGVLGMDYLSHFIIQLDFKNQCVTFFDPTTPYAGPEPSFNLGYIHDTPVFMTDFLGIPHSVVAIDTGLNGFGGVRKTLPATLGKDAIVHHIYDRNQNINGTVTSEAFRIKKDWQLAGTTFTDLLLDPAYNNSIGLEILSDFIVTLDFPHNKLFLKSIRPNHPAPSPQFGITQFQNGKWIFQHLDAHDKSLGLQENDEILTVNGTPVTSLPPGQLINTDDTTLTLKIKRNSQTLELKIPAED